MIMREMWVTLSTITTLWFFFDIVEVNADKQGDELEIIFGQRTSDDWERVWHHESHSRCREKLIRHLYWACEKDIYRLNRRSEKSDEIMRKRTETVPWIEKFSSRIFLRTRRNRRGHSGGSITAECCTRVGCTWEEYAEYCPSNKRKNHYII